MNRNSFFMTHKKDSVIYGAIWDKSSNPVLTKVGGISGVVISPGS